MIKFVIITHMIIAGYTGKVLPVDNDTGNPHKFETLAECERVANKLVLTVDSVYRAECVLVVQK